MMQFSSTPSCIGLVKECYRTHSVKQIHGFCCLLVCVYCLLNQFKCHCNGFAYWLVEVHYTVLHIGQKTVWRRSASKQLLQHQGIQHFVDPSLKVDRSALLKERENVGTEACTRKNLRQSVYNGLLTEQRLWWIDVAWKALKDIGFYLIITFSANWGLI